MPISNTIIIILIGVFIGWTIYLVLNYIINATLHTKDILASGIESIRSLTNPYDEEMERIKLYENQFNELIGDGSVTVEDLKEDIMEDEEYGKKLVSSLIGLIASADKLLDNLAKAKEKDAVKTELVKVLKERRSRYLNRLLVIAALTFSVVDDIRLNMPEDTEDDGDKNDEVEPSDKTEGDIVW